MDNAQNAVSEKNIRFPIEFGTVVTDGVKARFFRINLPVIRFHNDPDLGFGIEFTAMSIGWAWVKA